MTVLQVVEGVPIQGLLDWLRIPSVSSDPQRVGAVRAAGEWVCDFIKDAGGTAELANWKGAPLVVGELQASHNPDDAPAVLCYGHFDVQPPEPLELWESDPFEPETRDGWLYARGAADDKGQLFGLLTGAAQLADEGKLPVNVRVVCDGEEEIGGQSVCGFLEADQRGADAAIIFDGGMLRQGMPVFVAGVRGSCYLHVSVRTAAKDLHSGLYGGVVLNSLHALIDCLSTLLPRDGRLPKELEEGALEPSTEELQSWDSLLDGAKAIAQQGAHSVDEHAAAEFYARTWARPSLDVNGIEGGSPHLSNSVLAATAHANVSMRLAPGQDPLEKASIMTDLLKAAAPDGATVDVTVLKAYAPALFPFDARALKLAQAAVEKVAGIRPPIVRSGGSLPVAAALAVKNIPLVALGFDVPEGNIHAPNERFLIDHIPLAVSVARQLLTDFALLGVEG